LSIFEKLLEIQKAVDVLAKDGENTSDKYKFVSSDQVVNAIRPKMNELGLLLTPRVLSARLTEGTTKSGTTRYMTELTMEMEWVDVDSGDRYVVPFYAQGVDLAGEKGVGKAQTYSEKYYLLKQFHIGTSKDDPDSDGRNGDGEKKQRGTQAQKESLLMNRDAIRQMLNELCAGDAEKIKASCIFYTKVEARGYAGVDNIDAMTDVAVPVIYANIKKAYEKKTGHAFEFKSAEEA
jgi:hypothetical protein